MEKASGGEDLRQLWNLLLGWMTTKRKNQGSRIHHEKQKHSVLVCTPTMLWLADLGAEGRQLRLTPTSLALISRSKHSKRSSPP